MGSFNQATLLGNLGRDPEVRTTQSGKKVASFTLATTERWKDRNGEQKEATEWHNIVIWNEAIVDVVERYLSKGSTVMLQGQMKTRTWEKDGVKRYTTEVVLDGFRASLTLMPGGGDGGRGGDRGRGDDRDRGGGDRGRSGGGSRQASNDYDDEIPF